MLVGDHSSITSSKRWVGGVRKWQFLMIYSTVNHQRSEWVGLKKSKTWWRNTWMVPKQKIILLGFITTPTYLHIPRPTYYLLNFQNLHPVETKLKWVGSQWDNWIANDVYNPLETVICQIYIWNIDHSYSNDIIGR